MFACRPTWQNPTPLLSLLFFGAFFILFTFPITDGDCFWHLATGRWIFEHHTLPTSDPLSFTVTDHNPWRPESNRIPFLLKQYWLGQLALYGTWKLAGNAGIVLLRAVTYTAILAFLCIWMKRIRRGITPIVLVALTGLLLREIPNERPQLFSFVFMPLTLYLLERISEKREGGQKHTATLVALPLVMIVWANMHGAYLLGVVLIACYLVVHMYDCFRHAHQPDRTLLTSLLVGAAVTCLNPNGIAVWKEFIFSNNDYLASIYENLSPWQAAIQLHDWYPAYWIGILLALAGFIRCRSSVSLVHLLVISALIGLSMTGLRYLIFPMLAAPLFIRYLPELPANTRSVCLLIVGCGIWLGFTWENRLLGFKARWSFPQGAAAFVGQKAPSPNCFNHYDWGGYLAFTVQGLKTFTDGRGLVEELSLLYDQTVRGVAWRETFDRYNINTVIMPGMSESTGDPYPLIDAIADSSDWQLVFADDSALVFVRNSTPANRELIARYALNRQSVQLHLVRFADRLISENPNREGYWQTKANALQLLGDRPAALTAYRRTLQLNPNNTWAQQMLKAGEN